MVEAIIKIREGKTLADVAAEALAVLGAGGNPSADQEEGFLGYCNTPRQNGYTRIQCDEAYAVALEHIQAGDTCELVTVLWPGVEEPEISWPVEGGIQHLGRFAD